MFTTLEENNSKYVLSLQGDWTMKFAVEIYQHLQTLLEKPIDTISAELIDDIDSSGLQILVVWLRDRNASNLTGVISNPSPSVSSLLELYGLCEEITGGKL